MQFSKCPWMLAAVLNPATRCHQKTFRKTTSSRDAVESISRCIHSLNHFIKWCLLKKRAIGSQGQCSHMHINLCRWSWGFRRGSGRRCRAGWTGSSAGPPGSTDGTVSSSDKTAWCWGSTEHRARAYRPSEEEEEEEEREGGKWHK